MRAQAATTRERAEPREGPDVDSKCSERDRRFAEVLDVIVEGLLELHRREQLARLPRHRHRTAEA